MTTDTVPAARPEPSPNRSPHSEPVLSQTPNLAERLRLRLETMTEEANARSQARPAAESSATLSGLWARFRRNDGLERLIPVGLCVLLVAVALVSTLPVVPSDPSAPRGGNGVALVGGNAPNIDFGSGDGPYAPDTSDIYYGDGSLANTLQNPGGGTDAKTLLRIYTVRAGDTLNEIAGTFGLAPSTIYWANKNRIPNPSSLRVGQQLAIPPMDGLLVTVGAKDTLKSLAAKYKIAVQDIVDANNLPEETVTVGQTLLIPGASGGAMPKSPSLAPARAGSWVWPVGGKNYISQYYWSGHHALDIAAPYGTPVYAAANGYVVYSGWRSYIQGGNVVWIKHGTKLYSTYNHLSAWNVRPGQFVRAGQRIGSIGTSGMATGPHLHFEIWLTAPWALGDNSTTVNPCRYLAGC
jgi:murein DD-endopeptidase MepM/ murein hydrolase activator NlpD